MNFREFSKAAKLIYLLLLLQNCDALYSNSENVVELTSKSFENLVVKGDEVWIVEFYAPWCVFCQNLVPEYTKAARVLKGIIKMGAVNADEHRDLAAIYNVRGLPNIKIFGFDKQKPEDYNEGKNAKEIIETALKAVRAKVASRLGQKELGTFLKNSKSEYVVELTDSNFDETVLLSGDKWMVEFYAPWCGHCRHLEPHWDKAAKELKDMVKFGALDGTIHRIKTKEYGISGYPTIKYFEPGASPVEYNSGRQSSDIVAWALEKYEENLPASKAAQIIDEVSLFNICDGKQLAIVAFLPSILDCQSVCRNVYIGILNNLAERFKKYRWCWLWSEADAQPEVEKALKIKGSGYPVLAAVHYQNRTYSPFHGAFTEENIYSFLINLSSGKGTKIPVEVDVFPDIFDIEPWDGEDIEIPQLDERDEL